MTNEFPVGKALHPNHQEVPTLDPRQPQRRFETIEDELDFIVGRATANLSVQNMEAEFVNSDASTVRAYDLHMLPQENTVAANSGWAGQPNMKVENNGNIW